MLYVVYDQLSLLPLFLRSMMMYISSKGSESNNLVAHRSYMIIMISISADLIKSLLQYIFCKF